MPEIPLSTVFLRYAQPTIRAKRVDRVTTSGMEVLLPIRSIKRQTGRHLHLWIKTATQWAVAQGNREGQTTPQATRSSPH